MKTFPLTLLLSSCLISTCMGDTFTAGILQFDVNKNSIDLTATGPTGNVLSGRLATSVSDGLTWSNCQTSEDHVCLQFSNNWQLKASPHLSIENCSVVNWQTSSTSDVLQDCFNISSGTHWYGGGEHYYQNWNIEESDQSEIPCVTGDNGNQFGGIMERYWLSSDGFVVTGDYYVPMFFSLDAKSKQFCLKAQNTAPFYLTDQTSTTSLNYAICTGKDMKDVHLKWIENNNIRPTEVPDTRMIIEPIWSTWAYYKGDINTDKVMEFANNILAYNFSNSQIEIDDNWETCYGDQIFDTSKFPDVKGMVDDLHNLGFRVTLWVHPFINQNCPSYTTAADKGYLVKDRDTLQPGSAPWWDGSSAGIVDFTNEEAAAWWKNRLEDLRTQTGIDSFKFDAGETSWLPKNYLLNVSESLMQPNVWTMYYVATLSTFGGMIETRVGAQTYYEGRFVRVLDKDSSWGRNNGLQSVIPSALEFGLLGYPFFLPDMVGGNAYGNYPDKELFIRWMEANVFLPAIQFSIPPWVFDQETVAITQKMMALRENYTDYFYYSAQQTVDNFPPMICAVWCDAPNDSNTFTIIDQYMLGTRMIVAPIVEQGKTSRDIYLPSGRWHDQLNDVWITGPTLLTDYEVQLDELAFFTKW